MNTDLSYTPQNPAPAAHCLTSGTGNDAVKMNPAKVESITSWPTLKSPHGVGMFLGLANFYRRFIRGFSDLAKPPTGLLKKENLIKGFHWDSDAQKAFDYLRTAFTTAAIL